MVATQYMPFTDAQLLMLQTAESTNLSAINLLNSGRPPEGSLIYTFNQTQGKGQGNNLWESEPGKNITASALLYPDFLRAEQQFMLTKIVALSVCSLLSTFSLPFQPEIKWPNDIYIDRKKIAGILIFNQISGNYITHSVAGLGLNVNQTTFKSYTPPAISLKLLTGTDAPVQKVLTDWHTQLGYWYGLLKQSQHDVIDKAYLDRFYQLNQTAVYIIRNERKEATITGLAEYGMLRLLDKEGSVITCGLHEIQYVHS